MILMWKLSFFSENISDKHYCSVQTICVCLHTRLEGSLNIHSKSMDDITNIHVFYSL